MLFSHALSPFITQHTGKICLKPVSNQLIDNTVDYWTWLMSYPYSVASVPSCAHLASAELYRQARQCSFHCQPTLYQCIGPRLGRNQVIGNKLDCCSFGPIHYTEQPMCQDWSAARFTSRLTANRSQQLEVDPLQEGTWTWCVTITHNKRALLQCYLQHTLNWRYCKQTGYHLYIYYA